jgi:hypothetical protein
MLRSEALVQKMADKIKTGVPAIVNSANFEVAETQTLLKHATERAEKAEQLLKDMEAGLDGALTKSYKDAIERAEIAEKRAQTAEELQEKDRLWTVEADERAVNAENRAAELRAKLARSQNIITDHQILLTRARSRAEKAKQDLKDAESELDAFENRAIEFEKEAYEFKTKFQSIQRYTDKLQDHHNEREKEYMACNEEWKSREEDFIKQATELKCWGDEGISKSNGHVQKLEERIEEMAHDKQLIVKTFADVITKMQKTNKVMGPEELEQIITWANKEPGEKKGKETVAITREKARRNLEGLPFTPSLDTGNAVFEGPSTEAAEPVSVSSPTHAALPARSEDEEAILRKQMAAVQTEDGVLCVPSCSRGKWYMMNKSPK